MAKKTTASIEMTVTLYLASQHQLDMAVVTLQALMDAWRTSILGRSKNNEVNTIAMLKTEASKPQIIFIHEEE